VTTLAPLRNMTVLLAEDDPVMRGSLTRTLGLLFREVLAAGDGHQALEIFAAHRPNMAVLDISMPGPSGLQVAESIRKEDPDLPVIILTCHVDPSFMQQAVRLRLMDYLVKPVGGAALKQSLANCVQEMRKRKRLGVNLPGGSVLNLATGTVHREGMTHHLTANERRFLEILVKNRGVMLETVSICLAMEQNGEFTSQALRNLVWRLRSKIGPEAVVSSRDMGYMLA
jgi:DNA-binding response OmpR family regulator